MLTSDVPHAMKLYFLNDLHAILILSVSFLSAYAAAYTTANMFGYVTFRLPSVPVYPMFQPCVSLLLNSVDILYTHTHTYVYVCMHV